MTASLLQVFNAYATRKSLELKDCKFLYDGAILMGSQTPEEVTCLQSGFFKADMTIEIDEVHHAHAEMGCFVCSSSLRTKM